MLFWQKNPDSLPRSNYGGIGKRLFIGLMFGSCSLLALFILVAWLIPFFGLSAIHPALPYVLGFISFLLILMVFWTCIALAYHVYTGKFTHGIHILRRLVIKLIFPLMELLGRALGIAREDIRLSFVKVNNEMVLGAKPRVTGKDILVLLPHCIQNSHCVHRLTYNINHCQRCGLCPLAQLLDLRDEWGFVLVIATGGTIARRIVVETKARLILAVACERDLTSGIQDTYPLPVFGIINERPCGPCIDTTLNISLLKAALELFVRDDLSENKSQYVS